MATNNQVDSLEAERKKLKQEIEEIRSRIEDFKRCLVTFLTREFELKETLKEVETRYSKALKNKEKERGKRFREAAKKRKEERRQKMAEMHERAMSGKSRYERFVLWLEYLDYLLKEIRGEI